MGLVLRVLVKCVSCACPSRVSCHRLSLKKVENYEAGELKWTLRRCARSQFVEYETASVALGGGVVAKMATLLVKFKG